MEDILKTKSDTGNFADTPILSGVVTTPSDCEVMLKALVDELERWNDMQEDDRIGGRPITGHTYHVLSNAKKFLIKRGIAR